MLDRFLMVIVAGLSPAGAGAALSAASGLFAPTFRYQEYLRSGRGPAAALAATALSINGPKNG